MTQVTKAMKEKFFEDVSKIVKYYCNENTPLELLKLDSMMRSEVLFLIDDLYHVDAWGLKFEDHTTMGQVLEAALAYDRS